MQKIYFLHKILFRKARYTDFKQWINTMDISIEYITKAPEKWYPLNRVRT